MILIIVIVLVIEGVFACSIPGKRTKVNNCKMLGAEKLFRAARIEIAEMQRCLKIIGTKLVIFLL